MAVCEFEVKAKQDRGWVVYYEYFSGSETIQVARVSMSTTLDPETMEEYAARSFTYTMAFPSAEEAAAYFDCECGEPL